MTAVFRYHAGSSADAPPGFVALGQDAFRTGLQKVRQRLGGGVTRDAQWADDLLRFTCAALLADRRSGRPRAADGWTREIELHVELVDTAAWTPAVLAGFERLLRVATGDVWQLAVRPGDGTLTGPLVAHQDRVEVSLFSGGLDSTAHVARTAGEPGDPLLLVAHSPSDIHGVQDKVLRAIQRRATPRRPLCLRQVTVIPTTRKDGASGAGTGLDPSSRSRGLLHVALGLYAAAVHRSPTVAMPENGHLAINLPLTPARQGACSTRSVHPWVLHLLNQLIRDIGGDVTVHNPLLHATKGEVCRLAVDAGLTADDLGATVSCGSASALRLNGNCGYCLPCLIRRAGLLAALGHDPTDYQSAIDLAASEERWRHLADLSQWATRPITARTLAADLPLPPGLPTGPLLDTLLRGRQEVTAMLARLLPPEAGDTG